MPTPISISNEHLTVEVSSLGAEMQALRSSDGRSWLWNGDATFWNGRSPILFPIVGKAANDTITIDGQPFAMNQHGFARRSEFALASQTATMTRHELASSEATKAVYPFDFVLAVEHILAGRSLTVAAEVINKDSKPMPFGLGFHSAFVWPLPGAADRAHDVVLDNGAEPALLRLKGGLIDPEKLPSPFSHGKLTLDHSMFDADAMIFPEGAGDALRYGPEGGPALKFSFENLPNLALWTKPGAPFLCVEPWHGMAAMNGSSAELADRPSTTTLPAGATARFSFTVEIPA